MKPMKLLQTHVKSPFLKQASLLITGECVQHTFPNIYKQFAKEKVILTCCPEAEGATLLTGKTATLLACSKPKDVTVLTIDGSPHCFQLHAALNQALFLTKLKIPLRHIVIIENEAREVSSESVRVGRYLHLVQKCIHTYPKILQELNRLSLEHSCPTTQ
jgi:hypothetical protein